MNSARRDVLKWLACVPLALVLMSPVDAAKGKTPKAGKIEGTLVAKTSNSVSILTSSGTTVTLTVTAATKIELNDRHSTLAALPIGKRAQALFDPNTLVASKVEVNG